MLIVRCWIHRLIPTPTHPKQPILAKAVAANTFNRDAKLGVDHGLHYLLISYSITRA